ncbi:MAG TPA: Hsp20/alpha crystallin family protein [Chitinophagaceae bacterium]|nr:Hsp20/alpha crystallin family protein [Chitinophagaceae bacterium]
MSTQVMKTGERWPVLFDDFFKPWNEWFDNGYFPGRLSTMPAVNITENNGAYELSLAAPGMKKDDFKIDVNGDILTISSEKEETKEEKEKKFTRKEYSYSAFSRSFTLPSQVNKDKIDAYYENGVLKLSLPVKEEARKNSNKQIAVK